MTTLMPPKRRSRGVYWSILTPALIVLPVRSRNNAFRQRVPALCQMCGGNRSQVSRSTESVGERNIGTTSAG
jgi:hypothetical protein